jgi:hypothetical protein
MFELTKQENKIYTDLVRQYNSDAWEKVCSLDTFLESKWRNERDLNKAAIYYQIWMYAQEDF